jgi:transcriptional regulator with XRE-family HTH domain
MKGRLGASIREARKEHGMTQAQLGTAIGFHNSVISRWEKGDQIPDLDTLEKLTKIFGTSFHEWRDIAEAERRHAFMVVEKERHITPEQLIGSSYPAEPTLPQPGSPFYFASEYAGLVWARLIVTHKHFAPASLVLRWGPWMLEYSATLGHGKGVYLLFYKRSDEHPVPLFFEVQTQVEISFGTGVPPGDLPVQDVNHLWRRIVPRTAGLHLRYLIQSAYFALRELIAPRHVR